MSKKMRDQLVNAGVANLKEFGYPSVDKENIFTDYIYSAFFKTMLEGNLGDPAHDQSTLKELIDEINTKVSVQP